MIRSFCALAAIAIGTTAVFAQADVIAARKKLMKDYTTHGNRTMNQMLRDRMPYDQAKVDAALDYFIRTASTIPAAFAPGSYQGPAPDTESYAAQKAFGPAGQADIKARAEKFAAALAQAKPKIKDLPSLKAEWGPIDKDHCDSCHEQYRVRKPRS